MRTDLSSCIRDLLSICHAHQQDWPNLGVPAFSISTGQRPPLKVEHLQTLVKGLAAAAAHNKKEIVPVRRLLLVAVSGLANDNSTGSGLPCYLLLIVTRSLLVLLLIVTKRLLVLSKLRVNCE